MGFVSSVSILSPPYLRCKILAPRRFIGMIAMILQLQNQRTWIVTKKLELSTVKTAFSVTTVSEPLAFKLNTLLNQPIHTITNGFDSQDYSTTVDATPIFSIIYTGNIYEGRQNPCSLFDAIRLLLNEKKIEKQKLQLHFYGSDRRYLSKLLEGKGGVGLLFP